MYARKGEKELFLLLHQTNEGKQLLRVQLPGLMYLASARPDFPTNPPGFVMFLRKRLSGTRLRSIEQLGMDRILVLTFSKTQELEEETTFRLIIELITPGNIILLGRKPVKGGELSEEIVLSLLQPQSYKDRTVRGGIPYQAPPPAANIKIDEDAKLIQGVLDSGMDNLVKGLAVGLNLGGVYAELVCEKAKLDKDTKLSEVVVKKAIAITKKLLEEKPAPKIVDKDIFLFSKKDGEEFETISEALDKQFTNYEIVEEIAPRKQKGSILDQQALQKKGFEVAIETNQRKGEVLYERYQELKPLLEKSRRAMMLSIL